MEYIELEGRRGYFYVKDLESFMKKVQEAP